jgi:peptide/nickel transport system substrate-binding protein
VKGATYNETHFDDPQFTALIDQAKREPDQAKRNQLLHDAQEIEYNTGGLIVWGFKRQLDAYSNLVQGLQPHRYLPCSNFGFKRASFVTPPT